MPQSTDSQTALQDELLRGICGENKSESESENEDANKSENEGESKSEMVKREVVVTGADNVVDDGDDDDGNDDDGYPVVDSFSFEISVDEPADSDSESYASEDLSPSEAEHEWLIPPRRMMIPVKAKKEKKEKNKWKSQR